MIVDTETATKLEDFKKHKYSPEVIALMNAITKLDNFKELNSIVILNGPAVANVLVSVNFADILSIDVSNGHPEIDFEHFNQMTDEDKAVELELQVKTVSYLLNSIEELKNGLYQFGAYLFEKLEEIKKD